MVLPWNAGLSDDRTTHLTALLDSSHDIVFSVDRDLALVAYNRAVADVVEAMATHRPYRTALGVDAALEAVNEGRGSLFDSDAVDACMHVFREDGYQLPS